MIGWFPYSSEPEVRVVGTACISNDNSLVRVSRRRPSRFSQRTSTPTNTNRRKRKEKKKEIGLSLLIFGDGWQKKLYTYDTSEWRGKYEPFFSFLFFSLRPATGGSLDLVLVNTGSGSKSPHHPKQEGLSKTTNSEYQIMFCAAIVRSQNYQIQLIGSAGRPLEEEKKSGYDGQDVGEGFLAITTNYSIGACNHVNTSDMPSK